MVGQKTVLRFKYRVNTFKTSLSSIWMWANWKANSTLECTHESVSDISLAVRGMNVPCDVFHRFKWPLHIIYCMIVPQIDVNPHAQDEVCDTAACETPQRLFFVCFSSCQACHQSIVFIISGWTNSGAFTNAADKDVGHKRKSGSSNVGPPFIPVIHKELWLRVISCCISLICRVRTFRSTVRERSSACYLGWIWAMHELGWSLSVVGETCLLTGWRHDGGGELMMMMMMI